MTNSDKEILINSKAIFLSGYNVENISKNNKRSIIEFIDNKLVGINFDFRVENNNKWRMQIENNNLSIINKVKINALNNQREASCAVGSFLIIKNQLVLHARDEIPFLNNLSDDVKSLPRVLWRSKGLARNEEFPWK